MKTPKYLGVFARLWRWLRRLAGAKAERSAMEKQLLLPLKPPLPRTLIQGKRLPVSEYGDTNTPERNHVAPEIEAEPLRKLFLDDPRLVKLPSPRMSKIVLPTSAEAVMLEAPTTQFQAPCLVPKEKEETLELERAIHSMPDADEWEEPRNVVIHGSQTMLPVLPADMAPPTLVQPRVQDSPELLELIQEFNARYGESEP